MILYDWPRAAAFGRVVPKKKIYEHAGANAALKRRFASDLGRIDWSYKLSPETINLAKTKRVSEIQVFGVESRVSEPHRDVLRAIDKAIPSMLILEIAYRDRVRTCAACKRPSAAGGTAKVVSEIFMGNWLSFDAPRAPLPVALDMEALYENLLLPLVDEHSARLIRDVERFEAESTHEDEVVSPEDRGVKLEEKVEGAGKIRVKAREVVRLESRLKRERQFNRRVEINAELRAAKLDLKRLWQGQGSDRKWTS